MDAIRRAASRPQHGGRLRWSPGRPGGAWRWAIAGVVLLLVVGAVVGQDGVGPRADRLAFQADQDETQFDQGAAGEAASMIAAAEPAPAADQAAAGTGSVAGSTANGGAVSVGDAAASIPVGQPAPAVDRKVVRNAAIDLTVDDVDAASAHVRAAATAAGGIVFSSSSSYQGERRYGQIVLHVPFDRFDAAMEQLRGAPGLVRVESETTSSQDVTQEYVDAESRLRNLEATEQGLLTLMNDASAVGDVISVYRELSAVRGEIEALQGRLNVLTNQTDFSTITVSLAPKTAASAPAASGNALARAAREAWSASLALAEGVAIGVVRVVVFLWWLVPLAVIGSVVARAVRRVRPPAAPPAPTTGAPVGG